MYALHEAEVLYINKADFIKLSAHTDLVQRLYKHFPPFNFDIIGDKILKHDMLKKQQAHSLLLATKTTSKTDVWEDSKKMTPWLKKAKYKRSLNPDII